MAAVPCPPVGFPVDTDQEELTLSLTTPGGEVRHHDQLWFSFLLVAPDTINNHVKTCREEQKNLHFFAPEYGGMKGRGTEGGWGSAVNSVPKTHSWLWSVSGVVSCPEFDSWAVLNLVSLCLSVLVPLLCSRSCTCDHRRGYLLLWDVCAGGETRKVVGGVCAHVHKAASRHASNGLVI